MWGNCDRRHDLDVDYSAHCGLDKNIYIYISNTIEEGLQDLYHNVTEEDIRDAIVLRKSDV
jgi:hypothetical protein